MRTFDDILRWFNGVAAALLLLCGEEVPGRTAFLFLHLGAFALLPPLTRRLGGRGFTWRALLVRAALAALFLPLVFSEMGTLLPWVNPAPLEWHALQGDLALLGGATIWQVTAPLRQGFLSDLLMLCYATFYFLPLLLFLRLWARGDLAGSRQLLVAVTFGFTASYLGYLVTPVLAPWLVAPGLDMEEGGSVYRFLFARLDAMELNKRDCFPSGHTWLTLTVLHLAARRAPRFGLVLALPAAGLILATVTLRFHYLVDIFAGALLYYPALRFALWLDREGGGWNGPALPST